MSSTDITERERIILTLASRKRGVLVKNNRGWRACVADDLQTRDLIWCTERSAIAYRYAITPAGKAALG